MSAIDAEDFDERRAEVLEARLRKLGTRTPSCSHPRCGERNPFALTGVEPQILCREHTADAAGRDWIEDHHPAGQHNHPATVPLPANDHGVLSEQQAMWPRETLRNPESSPLLAAAAAVRGWLEILRLVIERTMAWIPAALEQLDALLRERLGEAWWDDLGWQL